GDSVMSTQSGKPLNPINHVSRKASEGSDTEPPGSRARQRAGTERHPVESERSPHTPKQARAQPVTSRFAAGGDAEQPAATRRDQIMSDHDLARFEASLRQLQRQEPATRPRASNLAPVPARTPVHASGRRHSGERFGDSFRSLESVRLPPPPAMSRRNIGTPVGIVVASILVATVAYYFAMGGWVPSSEPAPGPPQTTSSDPPVVAPPSRSTGQHVFRPTMPQDDDRATSAQNETSSQQGTETSQPARPSGDETAGMLPGEPGAQVGSASKASRVL